MKSKSSISVNIFLRVKKEGEAVVILFPIFSSSVYLKWPLEGIGEWNETAFLQFAIFVAPG